MSDCFERIVDIVYADDKKSAIMLAFMHSCIEKKSNVQPSDLIEIYDKLLPLVEKFNDNLTVKNIPAKQDPLACSPISKFNDYNFCMKPTEL